jgi:hypothetical protein
MILLASEVWVQGNRRAGRDTAPILAYSKDGAVMPEK